MNDNNTLEFNTPEDLEEASWMARHSVKVVIINGEQMFVPSEFGHWYYRQAEVNELDILRGFHAYRVNEPVLSVIIKHQEEWENIFDEEQKQSALFYQAKEEYVKRLKATRVSNLTVSETSFLKKENIL